MHIVYIIYLTICIQGHPLHILQGVGGVDDLGNDQVLVIRGEGQHGPNHQQAGGEESQGYNNYCILGSF